METNLIDNCFYCQKQRWGTYNSYSKDGKCLVTSLTEENCIQATRFLLQFQQEKRNEFNLIENSEVE